MFCPKCGAQLHENLDICISCGAKMERNNLNQGIGSVDLYNSGNTAPVRKRKQLYIILGVVAFLIAAGVCAFLFIFKPPFIAASGPKNIIMYETKDSGITDSNMEEAVNTIRKRFENYGFDNITIAREGSNRIRVEAPFNVLLEKAAGEIGKAGQLKFVGPDNSIILTNADIKNAYVSYDEYNQPQILLEFNDNGKVKFADATGKFIGKQIGIYFDDKLLTKPTVQSRITEGSARITSMASTDEAKNIASLIKSGDALPFNFDVVDFSKVE